MSYRFELLAHFDDKVPGGPLAISVAKHFNTKHDARLKLHREHGKKSVIVTPDVISSLLTQRPDEEAAFLRMVDSTSRKSVEIEFYLSNPEWKFNESLNYCSITFPSNLIDSNDPAYSSTELGNLICLLAKTGSLQSCYIESQRVMNDPQVQLATRRFAGLRKMSKWPSMIYWITYVPPSIRSSVQELVGDGRLTLIKTCKNGGCVVALRATPPDDVHSHIDSLLRTNMQLEIIN